jgi:TonB-dependent starch-binding outer membrane protein SusC
MRYEAFRNDTVSPVMVLDKDLLVYDSTRYTNFRKEFLNKQIRSKDAIFTFSGSKANIVYYLGTNYHEESTVFPGSFGNKFFSLHLHALYRSPNQRLYAALSGNYLNDVNNLISTDVTLTQLLPPNSPSLRTAENKTNWGDSITAFNNPLAFLDQKYHSLTDNSLISLQLNYQLSKKICVKTTLGHNGIWSSERSIIPIVSINPYDGSPLKGTAYFGNNTYQSWIAEPHVEFKNSIGKGEITMLFGNTWQRITNENNKIKALGYLTDENYSDTTGAGTVTVLTLPKNIYQYQGVFSRISFNWQDKYIGNLTGRIDWAKRFGLASIHRPLVALAVGWIFSRERFFKKIKFISFGKIRASYGITGNDPIGDMQYFDGWSSINTNSYRDQLTNDKLSSEVTQKFNVGIDLGFLHDRLFVTMTCFNNRSSNLLIAPENSGGNSSLKNWPVKIKNAGFDFTLRYENQSKHKLRWSSEVIITLPHNKLASFSNLAGSPYADILHEGKSLTMQQGYRYLGVNHETGVFLFKDKNNDGLISHDHDMDLIGHLDPKAYGGLKYDMSYKKFYFGFFIEGRVQAGYNFLNAILADATPGMAMLNQPVDVLNRWQKPGDRAIFQKFTTGKNSNVVAANDLFTQSDGRYADASFFRLKNIYFSGGLPIGWLKKLHLEGGSIYIQTNNALTITKFRLLDPETQTLTTLPPIKTFLIGFKLSF